MRVGVNYCADNGLGMDAVVQSRGLSLSQIPVAKEVSCTYYISVHCNNELSKMRL